MPVEWALSIVVPVFKGKGDIRNCSCYRAVKLLEHEGGGKCVKKWPHRKVSVDEMHFGFIPERGTIDAVFILRRIQAEYIDKGKKLYMCFVDMRESF